MIFGGGLSDNIFGGGIISVRAAYRARRRQRARELWRKLREYVRETYSGITGSGTGPLSQRRLTVPARSHALQGALRNRRIENRPSNYYTQRFYEAISGQYENSNLYANHDYRF